MHSRQKIVTHGLLPTKRRVNSAKERSLDKEGQSRMSNSKRPIDRPVTSSGSSATFFNASQHQQHEYAMNMRLGNNAKSPGKKMSVSFNK